MSSSNPGALVPFSQNLPTFLQGQDYHSTLEDQQVGTIVDRITQRDGSIVVEVGGVKSNPTMSIDVVILDAAPKGRATYRAYYEGAWTEGDSAAPACYSADGKHPSPHAEKPQCSNCEQCPMNVSGSGANGKGRACGYFKHVAVATYPDLDRVYRLKVSSRSLFSEDKNGVPSPLGGVAWGFHNYANLLQQMKAPWEAVVTRISLPKGQTHGFFFTPTGYVTKEQFDKAVALRSESPMGDILTVELSGDTSSAPVQNTTPALAPPVQTLQGKAKWCSHPALPQNVKDWVMQVPEEIALSYLQANFSFVL